jgi:hypothetical protein
MLRTVAIWLGVSALGVLNACAQNRAADPAPGWHFAYDGATAKLAYGQPHSDNVGLMLSCDAGAGRVLVTADAPGGRPELKLASGPTIQAVEGAVYDDPLTRRPALEAAAPAKSVVFERFAETGKLALIGGGLARPMPARGEARDDVRRFFDLCGAERA